MHIIKPAIPANNKTPPQYLLFNKFSINEPYSPLVAQLIKGHKRISKITNRAIIQAVKGQKKSPS